MKPILPGVWGRLAFRRDLVAYRRAETPHKIPIASLWPIYRDRFHQAGSLGELFHQDLWAARQVIASGPARHLDVGSGVNGFVAHCLPFLDIEQVDPEPPLFPPRGLTFVRTDCLSLAGIGDASRTSLSSLGLAGQVGLGRFGEPVDPGAPAKLIQSLQRVLAPEGRLYFGLPVSARERVEFNARRLLHPSRVLAAFDRLRLASFALVKDDGQLYENLDPAAIAGQDDAWGLFEFVKPKI